MIGYSLVEQLFVLIHLFHGDVRLACNRWINLLSSQNFCLRTRYKGTTCWYVWKSWEMNEVSTAALHRYFCFIIFMHTIQNTKDNDGIYDEALSKTFAHLRTNRGHGLNSAPEHPLNSSSIDFIDLERDLKDTEFPILLDTYAVPKPPCEKIVLNKLVKNAKSFEINLDLMTFDLCDPVTAWKAQAEYKFIIRMKDLYRFMLQRTLGKESAMSVATILQDFMTENLDGNDHTGTDPAEKQSFFMYAHMAAIAIQTQARRYIVWKQSFAPGNGQVFKKAKKSFESNVHSV